MLVAVIEAQVKGGQSLYKFLLTELDGFDGPFVLIKGHDIECFHVLELLLDPEGLRGAYDRGRFMHYVEGEPSGWTDSDRTEGWWERKVPDWRDAATDILNAWLSQLAGDTEAAIRTAFKLLPAR